MGVDRIDLLLRVERSFRLSGLKSAYEAVDDPSRACERHGLGQLDSLDFRGAIHADGHDN